MYKKKFLSKITATALAFSFICGMQSVSFQSFFVSSASESEVIGDANLDKSLNVRDAALIAQKAAKGKINELPKCADHNLDDKVNIRDAASIASFIAHQANQKVQINFRFAEKSEGAELRINNEDYFNNLSQQDLDFRMHKENTSLDEFKDFSESQILEFTTEQKRVITKAVIDIQDKLNEKGFNLPFTNEIVFINTTARDELGAQGYTQKNQIYLSDSIVCEPNEIALERVIIHEMFHVLTRNNPQFRKNMYKAIGFSISANEPEFPENIQEILISNPDVEKNDSYATFTINGKKRDCYMVWYLKNTYENSNKDLFSSGSTGLIPKDDLSKIYDMSEASDFWSVVGKNTQYVIAAEECLANNFAFAVTSGPNRKYESPEIIEEMVKYMKSLK